MNRQGGVNYMPASALRVGVQAIRSSGRETWICTRQIAAAIRATRIYIPATATHSREIGIYRREIASYSRAIAADTPEIPAYSPKIAAAGREMTANR